jgi:nicotinamidase-related amidase
MVEDNPSAIARSTFKTPFPKEDKRMYDILFVIDMINDFIDERGSLYCGGTAREIIPHVKDRMLLYQRVGRPIVLIQDRHDKDDPEFEKFPPHAVADTWGSGTIPELVELGTKAIIVDKKSYDGFHDTPLDTVIAVTEDFAEVEFRIETIEVAGVCTNICVMDTVSSIAKRGIKPIVFRNCVADFDQEAHEYALKRMAMLYGAEIV